ncbi:hypothetical protein G4B88_027028 [Cannabis sativa]|nr:hypothetical protein G4B88_027028 [Cannabis sativa]
MINTQQFTQEKYQIAAIYILLCPPQDRKYWIVQLWGRFNIPKHRFILWLALQGRLRTREKSHRFVIIDCPNCLLCNNGLEIINHLCFECSKTKQCVMEISHWLGWGGQATTELNRVSKWINRTKTCRFSRKVMVAGLASLVYHVWKTRNELIWQAKEPNWVNLTARIKENVKQMVVFVWPKKVSQKDEIWFNNL